jgi:hypothetical protein
MQLVLFEVARGAFSVLVIVLGGMAILACISPQPIFPGQLARLALAHLVGTSTMAWSVTAVAVLTGRLTPYPAYAVFVLAAFFALLSRERRKEPAVITPLLPTFHATEASFSLWNAVVMLGVASGIVSICFALLTQHRLDNDAYHIWALKAKALWFAGSLSPLLQGCCYKPNYPVLFPLQSWWVYWHIGHVHELWHQANAFFSYLDMIAITYSACRAHMRRVWASMASAVVANNLMLFYLVKAGMAEPALSAYILSTAFFFSEYLSTRVRTFKICALLLMLGTLQTKNEGFAFGFLAITVLIVVQMFRHQLRAAALSVGFYVVAIAPWTFFKLSHHLVSGPEEPLASMSTLNREWASRLTFILHGVFTEGSPAGLPFLLILCIPLLWMGWKKVSKPALAILTTQFFFYLVIYFIVEDQVYQFGFEDRAVSHIAPALIVISLIGYHRSIEAKQPLAIDTDI